jgi:hypothetical protein
MTSLNSTGSINRQWDNTTPFLQLQEEMLQDYKLGQDNEWL